ncbi:MAG: DUF1778 domain-containing protein [Actinobacteria bacterium]|nr:DUF1778 domain-containing protein [Actinomycetota bacterium]
MAEPLAESRQARTSRINLRATRRQEELLRRAAEATDHTVTDFVLDSAVDRAERVLADLRWFTVTEEQYTEFLRLLDAPLPSTEKFDRLFSRPSPFTAPE